MMTTNPSATVRRSRVGRFELRSILSVFFVLSLGIFLWVFHRTEVVSMHATLQGGRKVDVQLSLQATWRWQTPDQIKELSVQIDGVNVPVAPDAYAGLARVDPHTPPAVLEIRGFPEIVVRGRGDSHMDEVHFRFQNYSFSERRVVSGPSSETKFYAMPLPTPAVASARQPNPTPQVVTFGSESVKIEAENKTIP